MTVPKQMNFRESSKRPLTPTPCPLEWPLSLEIMCMYFILSGPHTYIYATICGAVNFWRLCIQFKKKSKNDGRRSKAVWIFFWKFIRFGTLTRPCVNLKAATPQKMKISPVPQMILTTIFLSYRSQNSGELFPKGPASNSIILKKVTFFQGIRQSEPRDPRSSKVYKVIRIQLQQSKERGGGGV